MFVHHGLWLSLKRALQIILHILNKTTGPKIEYDDCFSGSSDHILSRR